MMLQLPCRKSIINLVCVYTPKPGLSAEEKYHFYEQLLALVTSVAPSETLIIAGDFKVMLVSIAKVSVGIMMGVVMEDGIRKE